MEIHPSVVLLEPVLQNLIDTDQMIIFRYVQKLITTTIVMSFCIKLCESSLRVLHSFYINIYMFIHPFSKMLKFGNIYKIYVPFVFPLKRC